MGVPARRCAGRDHAAPGCAARPSRSPTTSGGTSRSLYAQLRSELALARRQRCAPAARQRAAARLANADSDAFRLDSFPLADAERLARRRRRPHLTADQVADADVLLSSAYVALGENMLTGQRGRRTSARAGTSTRSRRRSTARWPHAPRGRSRSGGLTRMRPQDPGYDSLRVEFSAYCGSVANGGWSEDTIAPGAQLHRGDHASAARINALRARLSAEGYALGFGRAPWRVRRLARRRRLRLSDAPHPRRDRHAQHRDRRRRSTCPRNIDSRRSRRTSSAIAGCRARSATGTSSSTCRSFMLDGVRQRAEGDRDESHRRQGVRGQGDAGVQRLDGVRRSFGRTGT